MREPLQEGYYYHIYKRGNNREDIFREEANYQFFLEKYWEYYFPILETYAYCLLKNHFHFLVKIRKSEEMKVMIEKK